MCQPTHNGYVLLRTNCRSAVYSDRFRTCRLSRYNQKDGMRIIYDADYDYYENLMCKCLLSGANEVVPNPLLPLLPVLQ